MSIKRLLPFIIAGTVMLCAAQRLAAANPPVDARAQRLENKADKRFIRGDFDKSMQIYRQADQLLGNTPQQQALRLKMARFYIMLQDPAEASAYYGSALENADTLLTVNDICFYIDALRRLGKLQQAEIVARGYMAGSPYSRNQRLVNTCNALANQQYYYLTATENYNVKGISQNTPLPEYWIGEWNGEMFYTVSHGRIQDPLKIFYHQTRYITFHNSAQPAIFSSIPRDLHSGPVAFSSDKAMMIATGISYRSSDRIISARSDHSLFVTQLYCSFIAKNNTRWSRFEPLFPNQQGYNYAHPMFFNNDQSLLFSSDRPGGYGGMDLYVSHRDAVTGKWGEPQNMGPLVNTEGDEIYPGIIDGYLYFSSNGQVGFGGYDLYRIRLDDRGDIVPGTLLHFSYPVNSVYNDFGMYVDGATAWFVSDRGGMNAKDDIYTFALPEGGNEGSVSAEQAAMEGNLNVINGLQAANSATGNVDISTSTAYTIPEEQEVLASLYFDFNRYFVSRESAEILKNIFSENYMDYIDELSVIGYADDIGNREYNQRLSENRANAVAGHIRQHFADSPRLHAEGRGQLSLSQSEKKNALEEMGHNPANNLAFPVEYNNGYGAGTMSLADLISINSKLRRVDIVVTKRKK